MRISDWSSDVCSSDLLVYQFAYQVEPVVAEIHVRTVHEHRRRAEPAARNEFVGRRPQAVLVLLTADIVEEVRRPDAGPVADPGQHVVLADVVQVRPVGFEGRARVGHDKSFLAREDRAPGGLYPFTPNK